MGREIIRVRRERRRRHSRPHLDLRELGAGRRATLGLMALFGAAISLYLAIIHYTDADAICVVGSGCNVVEGSAYSTIAGIPVALLGLLGYVSILATLMGIVYPRYGGIILYSLALAGLVFALYLTYLEVFVIVAACFYCLLSFATIAGVFVHLFVPRPIIAGLPWHRFRPLSIAIVGVVLVSAVGLHSVSGTSLSTGDKAFAEGLSKHLSETGAVMYGAYWCPHCEEQKQLFGETFEYVRYVECDPKGENADPALCAQKGIQGYPTWEIGGQFYEGEQSLETLARLSGYE